MDDFGKFSRGFNFVSRWIGIILPIGGGTDDKEYDDCDNCDFDDSNDYDDDYDGDDNDDDDDDDDDGGGVFYDYDNDWCVYYHFFFYDVMMCNSR